MVNRKRVRGNTWIHFKVFWSWLEANGFFKYTACDKTHLENCDTIYTICGINCSDRLYCYLSHNDHLVIANCSKVFSLLRNLKYGYIHQNSHSDSLPCILQSRPYSHNRFPYILFVYWFLIHVSALKMFSFYFIHVISWSILAGTINKYFKSHNMMKNFIVKCLLCSLELKTEVLRTVLHATFFLSQAVRIPVFSPTAVRVRRGEESDTKTFFDELFGFLLPIITAIIHTRSSPHFSWAIGRSSRLTQLNRVLNSVSSWKPKFIQLY